MQSAKEKLYELYQLYEKPMYYIAYAILHNHQQAEDAVSEAFCKVIHHLDKIDTPDSLRTKQYMIKVIRNTAISQYRKNLREAEQRTLWDEKVLQIPTNTETDIIERHERYKEEQIVLSEMLNVLNETDTKIVLLRCQKGLSFRKIAEQCNMKETTVRKRFERARKAMIKQKGVTSYEQLFSL